MAELSSNALVTFLQGMVVDGTTIREDKPALLQIRSIIPVLKEGDLWPNQGFFLRVSDLSHAIYVSLPQEDDGMVLYDKLHIGQYLFAYKLEAAYPVPMLKGIRPLQGRHPCLGYPKDLIPLQVLEKFLGVSKLDYEQKDFKNPEPDNDQLDVEEKRKCCIASALSSNEESSDGNVDIGVVNEKQHEKPPLDLGLRRRKSLNSGDQDSMEKIMKKKSPSIGLTSRGSSIYRPRKSDDVESTLSFRSRKNDSESYYKGLRKCKTRYGKNSNTKSSISTNSTIFKRKNWSGKEATTRVVEITEIPDSPWHDSSDDATSTITKNNVTSIATKSSKTKGENRVTDNKDNEVSCSSIDDQIGVENDVSWDLLPESLIKLGKELLQRRDMAIVAAVEALLEASAAEKLLKCLSLYSEVLSAKDAEEHHQSVDKFLTLEHDLSQAKKSTSQKPETHQKPEELKTETDRKKNATEWIKTALESNLESLPNPTKSTSNISSDDLEKPITSTRKAALAKTQVECQPETEHRKEWKKGTEAMAEFLSNESNKWFLGYVEEYLDWVSRKSQSSESDVQLPEMMFRIKKVSDWLDKRFVEKSTEDSEMESCREIRNKIYGILLTHVERSARNALVEG